jgi:hypothetical protein
LQRVKHHIAGYDSLLAPRDRILTQQWPGEWPGVGVRVKVSSS